VINVPARGIGGKTVQRILDVAQENTESAYQALSSALTSPGLGKGAKKKLAAFRDLIEQLSEEHEKRLPSDLLSNVIERTGYRDALREQDSPEADARLENIEELSGSLLEYERDAEALGEQPTLSSYLERVSLVAAVDTMVDEPSVSLMTVHSAKGLEFDCVWLTGMEEEVFPYKGLNSEDLEELDEERRLAYVAVTRARQRLNISHVGVRNLFGQTRYLAESRFLGDIPEVVAERQGARPEASRRFDRPSWAQGSQRPRWAQGSQRPSARSPAPGERIVDYEAYDDVPGDELGLTLRPGDRVSHKKFGTGIVEQVQYGSKPKVTARFGRYGSKQVLAEFLEPG
jgi:DNA helicase-2/ATP-dependent DNA helicase PcrA